MWAPYWLEVALSHSHNTCIFPSLRTRASSIKHAKSSRIFLFSPEKYFFLTFHHRLWDILEKLSKCQEIQKLLMLWIYLEVALTEHQQSRSRWHPLRLDFEIAASSAQMASNTYVSRHPKAALMSGVVDQLLTWVSKPLEESPMTKLRTWRICDSLRLHLWQLTYGQLSPLNNHTNSAQNS